MAGNARILIVEDERIISLDLTHQLIDLGYDVIANVDTGEKALEIAVKEVPDLVIMDVHLAGEIDGITAATMIQQQVDVPVLYATAYADNATLGRAKVSQPYGYIIKPIDLRELQISVAIALQLHESHLKLVAAEDKLQRQSQELEQALQAVQRLDNMKGQFVRNASHELRTPLALILGYAEMLSDGDFGDLSPGMQTAMNVITRRANELRLMIEDLSLLMESSEEQGSARQSVALESVLDHEVAEWGSKAELAGLTFTSRVATDLPVMSADPVHLHRIFAHLFSNAIKFTPAGGTISVKTNVEYNSIKVIVEDTGMGIPQRELSLIFERFYQVDGSSKRRYPGMGVGLAVVKESVEALGGEVSVVSKEGHGSCFTVNLPFSRPERMTSNDSGQVTEIYETGIAQRNAEYAAIGGYVNYE